MADIADRLIRASSKDGKLDIEDLCQAMVEFAPEFGFQKTQEIIAEFKKRKEMEKFKKGSLRLK